MKTLLSRLVDMFIILGLAYILSGCATFKGVATDIEHLAVKINSSIVTPTD